MVDAPAAWGFSIFCDDIRQEMFGKHTIVGVYQSELIFNGNYPFAIPKFGIIAKYYETPGTFPDGDIEVGIYLPGSADKKPSFVQKVHRNTLNNDGVAGQPVDAFDSDVAQIATLTIPFILSPLIINIQGRIKVRAKIGDHIVKLGTLNVRQAREGEIPAVAR